METLTDFIVDHSKYNISLDLDEDGIPFCRLHWQLCFPGGFCTPWNYVSQNVIDCSPIEHLNHRGSKVLAVPVFTVHAHDEPELKGGFGVLNFRCHAAAGATWSHASGRSSTVPFSMESPPATDLRPFMVEHYAFVGPGPVAEMGSMEKSRLIYTAWIPGLGRVRWTTEKVAECDRALEDYGHHHDRKFFNP